VSEDTAAQFKAAQRKELDVINARFRELAKTDFHCFAAGILGSMNDLYLMHFQPYRVGNDPGTFEAGFYDDDNNQIIQLLIEAEGELGLLNLNLENGLGDNNERVSKNALELYWERYKAD